MLLTVAAVVVVLAGLRAASSLAALVLLSGFLSVLLAAPVRWLRRHGVPTTIAVLLVVLAAFGIGLGLGTLVGASATGFSRALPSYQARLTDQSAVLLTWLENHGVDVSAELIRKNLDAGRVMGLVSNLLSGLGGVLGNGVVILLIVIFSLLEMESFPNRVRAAFTDAEPALEQFGRFAQSLQDYVVIKTQMSLATGALVATVLWMVGVDFPLLWGLLAFLLNYIPNIGSVIAAVPAVLLAAIQFGAGQAVLVALAYLVINAAIGNIVEPRLMGQGLGLSTLAVFVSLLLWAWVLGPVGMLLAVPLTVALKLALETGERTRWAAVLLGPGSVAARPATAHGSEGPG